MSEKNNRMLTAKPEPAFDLYVVRNFLNIGICKKLIAHLRDCVESPALTYGRGETGEVEQRIRKVARLSPSAETATYVSRRLNDHTERLAQHFGLNIHACEEPQFLRYRKGDFFVAHQDGNTGMLALETDRARRISVSLFLNSQSDYPRPDTYGGGSLVFSDWRNGGRLQFKGEPGTLIAFRSETTHEVTPVTVGERYSIVTWFR